MKHLLLLLLCTAALSCTEGDKHREDFPDTHNKDDIESNERLMRKAIEDTTTIRDTTPGVVKFPEAE